jgi:N-acetylmuramoyl-L-alanine amidase
MNDRQRAEFRQKKPARYSHTTARQSSRPWIAWLIFGSLLLFAGTAAWIVHLYWPPVPPIRHRPPPLSLIDHYPAGFYGPKRLVIDPGHGGEKLGAESKHSRPEKEANLEIALALGEHLEKTGKYQVRYTRTDDSDVSIAARRRFRCDAFISLHADWEASGRAQGMRLIWSYRQKRRDAAQWSPWLANYLGAGLQAQGFEMYDKGPEIMDVGRLAGSYHYVVTWPRYGVFVTDFRELGVLGRNSYPAVLVETHYLTSKKDVKRFQNSESYAKFCKGVELGLLNFFTKKDGLRPAIPDVKPSGRWVIQVAAASEKSDAEKMLERMGEQGFAGFVESTEKGRGTFHRVRIGPFDTEAETEAARATLTVHGYPDHWKVFVPTE